MNQRQIEFGTDGIRGKAGTELSPTLIIKLGYLIGQTLTKSGPILIGNDSRRSNSMIVSALTAGLNSAGREVWKLGLCPTPAVSILIKQFDAAGGVMVSASHNPPEDNGIKVFDEKGLKINSKSQNLISSNIKNVSTDNLFPTIQNNYGSSYYRRELLKHYRDGLIESAKEKNLVDVSIVLDLCWGSATAFGEEIFKELGANVKVINHQPNGDLINVNCGSTNTEQLKKKVLDTKAEMGFAFDGDSDRVIAIDGKGRIIDGDHILYLWGKVLKERDELPDNRLVGTVMSNLGFENAWKSIGGILERTPVGDQYVHTEMIAKGAALGGEQSGHILSLSNGLCGDGLYTAIQIASICKSKKLNLAKWRDQSFQPFPQKIMNIPVPKKFNSSHIMESKLIKDKIAKAEESLGANGRVLVRASGTQPLIRVMVEASEEKITNMWAMQIATIIKNNLE